MLSAPLLTTQEVAELLKVSEATVRSWIKNQELRAGRAPLKSTALLHRPKSTWSPHERII